MAKILDCESLDSIYKSLEDILKIDADKIEDFLRSIDIDKFYEENQYYSKTSDQLLLDKIKKDYRIGIKFDQVCWFHLTRALNDNVFTEGIHTLGEQIDSIWENLYSLVDNECSKEEWLKFKEKVEHNYSNHSAYLYRLKVKDKIHWGPYAMLIREAGFKSHEIGNHDYLRIPEIIEDISICFEELYGYDLSAAFINNSKPAIIKFTNDKTKEYYIGTVLYYLYNKIHNRGMSLNSNTCFDGNGISIPKERILSIKYVNY